MGVEIMDKVNPYVQCLRGSFLLFELINQRVKGNALCSWNP
uniref:Uncharacterized protein n=1 Tax=Arundo donax TaxID=35708 RepID=A0A0A9C9H0_ARUDO